MSEDTLVRLNDQPLDVLMLGIQRDGIPVVFVKPAEDGSMRIVKKAEKPSRKLGKLKLNRRNR